MSAPARIAWEQFTLDPRRAANAEMRASDQDRDVALTALGEAFADGRLDRDEFDERSTCVQATKRLGGLVVPLADLAAPETVPTRTAAPSMPPVSAAPARPEPHRFAGTWVFLVPTVVCWVIWLHASLESGGFDPQFPWPLFVMLGTARMAFGHRHGRDRAHGCSPARGSRRLDRPGA